MRYLLGCVLAVAACGTDYMAPAGPDAGAAPTFYQNVSPILVANCLGCHQAGGIAPFPMRTYEDVTAAPDELRALGANPDAIDTAVQSRIMPPFLADDSGACQTYQGPGWLSDADRQTIHDWVAAGSPEGTPPDPLPSPPQLPALSRVDATLAMAAPYTPDAQLTDDYRCFVIAPSPAVTTDQYVIGFSVAAGNAQIVHHAILFSIDDATAESQAEAKDTGSGYTCFGGPGVATHIVAAWAPGEGASTFPTDTGVPIRAGRKFILQVHYHVLAGAAPDQSTVRLMLAAGVSRPAVLEMISNNQLAIPPNTSNYTIPFTFQIPTTVPSVTVWGLFPHMHLLGQQLHLSAQEAGADTCLVDVPRWNFDWQRFYFYANPVTLHGGDRVELDCTYDSQGRSATTYFGEGTNDEMCLTGVYLTQ